MALKKEQIEKITPWFEEGVETLQKIKQADGIGLDEGGASFGNLPENAVFRNLFDKIATQYFISNYNYQNRLFGNYLKASTVYGGVDEILSVGLANYRQFNINVDWTKDRYFNEQYVKWAPVEFEDQYLTTINTAQAQRAFISVSTFGNMIGQMLQSIQDRKSFEWYNRIINFHTSYPIIVEIDTGDAKIGSQEFGVAVGSKITEYMDSLTLPSGDYNLMGQISAIPYAEQQLTLNLKYKNVLQWVTARLYNPQLIEKVDELNYSNFLDYKDDGIIGALDTPNSIYIGLKSSQSSYQVIAQRLETNHYLTEFYTATIVPFRPTILFRLKGASNTPRTDINTVITTTEVTISEKDPNKMAQAVKTAVAEANTNYKATNAEFVWIQRTDGQGTGTASLNATAESPYTGRVIISFTTVPAEAKKK